MVSRIDSVNCADAKRDLTPSLPLQGLRISRGKSWRSVLHATQRGSDGRAATAALDGGYERTLARRQQPMQ